MRLGADVAAETSALPAHPRGAHASRVLFPASRGKPFSKLETPDHLPTCWRGSGRGAPQEIRRPQRSIYQRSFSAVFLSLAVEFSGWTRCVGANDAAETAALPVKLGSSIRGELSRRTPCQLEAQLAYFALAHGDAWRETVVGWGGRCRRGSGAPSGGLALDFGVSAFGEFLDFDEGGHAGVSWGGHGEGSVGGSVVDGSLGISCLQEA